MGYRNKGFNYVIAKPWHGRSPLSISALCVYAYGSTVFFGNEGQAIETRNLIRGRSGDKDYEIYPIDSKPFKPSR